MADLVDLGYSELDWSGTGTVQPTSLRWLAGLFLKFPSDLLLADVIVGLFFFMI